VAPGPRVDQRAALHHAADNKFLLRKSENPPSVRSFVETAAGDGAGGRAISWLLPHASVTSRTISGLL
jgi:hypothetical protein